MVPGFPAPSKACCKSSSKETIPKRCRGGTGSPNSSWLYLQKLQHSCAGWSFRSFVGLAVAKGRAQEPQRMIQASSHTRLQFQAQAVSFSFRRKVPCVLQCDHSDLWDLCECDANKRCRARHSNRTSVLNLRNLGAFPALRGGTRRRNPRSEPRIPGWELCVPSRCARAVGAGAGSSAQAQQGQGTAAPCPQGWPGLHCTRCSHRASPVPAQPQGTQCGTEGLPAWHCLWDRQGSRDPDTHGHPWLLFPSQELLAKPQAPAGHSSQGWIHV